MRRRPGMYVGGADERGLHHLAAEVLDNAMDEAVAGYANRIEIELAAGNWLTIRDNGRGVPIDPHPRFPNKSALEVILTTLHSGGKFGGNAYRTSGGLHGVGISVVNALSDSLEIEVARDRRLWRQRYSRGGPSPLSKTPARCRTAAARHCAFIPIRKFSAMRGFARRRFTAWRARRRICSGVWRSAGVATRSCRVPTAFRRKRGCISRVVLAISSPQASTGGRP